MIADGVTGSCSTRTATAGAARPARCRPWSNARCGRRRPAAARGARRRLPGAVQAALRLALPGDVVLVLYEKLEPVLAVLSELGAVPASAGPVGSVLSSTGRFVRPIVVGYEVKPNRPRESAIQAGFRR